MARILSVAYDPALLSSRQLLLESLGCEVVSASDFGRALHYCNHAPRFQLFILGHSIPCAEKETLVAAFRAHGSAPIIALKKFGEESTPAADIHIEPEPSQLLDIISRLISYRVATA
jgi:CheY-like chemotaxis protein